MLLTLTQTPTEKEWQFFTTLLTESDYLLLSGSACYLSYGQNPLTAQGLIRERELKKLGNPPDSSWQIISDSDWVRLTLNAENNVEW